MFLWDNDPVFQSLDLTDLPTSKFPRSLNLAYQRLSIFLDHYSLDDLVKLLQGNRFFCLTKRVEHRSHNLKELYVIVLQNLSCYPFWKSWSLVIVTSAFP